MTEGKPVELLRDRRGIYGIGVRTRCAMTSNTEHKFADTNRHLVEVPTLSPSLGARPPPSPLRLPPPPAAIGSKFAATAAMPGMNAPEDGRVWCNFK